MGVMEQQNYKTHLSLNTLKSSLRHSRIINEPSLTQYGPILKNSLKHLKTCLRNLWNFLEEPLKHFWQTLDTSLKHPWNLLFYFKHSQKTQKTSLKDPWNFVEQHLKFFETFFKIPYTQSSVEIPLKLHWIVFENSLKHQLKLSGNTLKLFLQHPWNFLETPWTLCLNSSRTSLNHP